MSLNYFHNSNLSQDLMTIWEGSAKISEHEGLGWGKGRSATHHDTTMGGRGVAFVLLPECF